MTPAVEAKDVFRVYTTAEGEAAAALQGLSLTVPERETIVVLGPSGSGKSTFLRIVAGLDRPSAGRVRVFGADVGKLGGRALADYRATVLGYVDQHYSRALAPELTALDLVGLRLRLAGATRRERDTRAAALLERVGLGDRRDAFPGELSGGEQQRVAVCAALAHRPRLLLADEPTGELDAASAEAVYRLLAELTKEEDVTAVVVSHDLESVAIADRVVRIRDGRVSEEVASGASDEAVVVGRGGWLRIPEELLQRAGIRTHATVRLDDEGIVVEPVPGAEQPAPAMPAIAVPPPPAGPARVVAEARGVAKTYGSQRALAGVDAAFPAGRLVAVTGPSGSGKTTLLHLLAGIEIPTEGEVVVLGTALADLGRDARAAFRRDHVSVIGQEPGLVPFLSAQENVELALTVRGVPADDGRERALEALSAVGLAERSGQRVFRLSAGERERVAIARALAARPDLLLADEPTARLDQANPLEVATLLARLARELGTAIVCATHDRVVIEQADDELALRAAVDVDVPLLTTG